MAGEGEQSGTKKVDLVVPVARNVDLSKEDPEILNQLYINKGWTTTRNADGTFNVDDVVVKDVVIKDDQEEK